MVVMELWPLTAIARLARDLLGLSFGFSALHGAAFGAHVLCGTPCFGAVSLVKDTHSTMQTAAKAPAVLHFARAFGTCIECSEASRCAM